MELAPEIEALLHPARLRLARVLSERSLTVDELAGAVPDIPRSSIYRHLARLVASGVVEVVEHRHGQGGPQRVYRLVEGSGQITTSQAAELGVADLTRLFTGFVGSLLADWERYVATDPDPAVATPTFSQVWIGADRAEMSELMGRLRELIEPYRERPGVRRTLSIVVLPTGEGADRIG
ncbi:MAG: helix-turn-helix domain-containing protein [Acidimicrobiia bacterium]|nr:MAG: helix-turn-helix domain-containing protein [Acidimicrobiia bacterium]